MGKLLKIAGGSYTEVAGSILDHAREGGITHTSTGKINFSAGGDITNGIITFTEAIYHEK